MQGRGRTGRPAAPPPGRTRAGLAGATRRTVALPPPPRTPRRSVAQRLRTALVVASALVLGLSGTAWALYRDVTAGITTTDVITGADAGGAQNILLVGVDSRTDAQGNPLPPEVLQELHSGPDTGVLNSDTIILLHVPEGGGAATAFSIPRDSYVDIPGYREDKINSALPAVTAATAEELVADGVEDPARVAAESARAGRSTLIDAVEELTGQTVHHYAELNLLGFHNLTKAIGGVDVCLNRPVDEPLSGARFPAGPQTIAGGDALAFVRQRHGLPEGDLSRIRRQQVFLAAVADKVLSAGVLTDPGSLAALVDVVQKSVVIDADWDLLAFARQAADIAAGNLAFLTIPTRGPATNARGDVVLVDRDDVRRFVEQQIEERDRAAEAALAAPPPPPAPPPQVDLIASRYVVDVHNGSGIPGLAATVSRHLRELDFVPGTVDNSAATPTSVVRYTDPDHDAAEALAELLGDLDVEHADDVPRGHLHVVVGADFDATTVGNPATDPPAPVAPAPVPVAARTDQPITAAGVPCID